MKKIFVITILIFVSVIFNACSSDDGNSQNPSVNKVTGNSNVVNVNSIRNGNTVTPLNVANATNANTIQTNVDANKVQSNDLINRRNPKLNNSVSSTEKPKVTFVPAPHNSEIGTRMGDNGEFIQVRNFKSDSQIKTIEHIVSTENLKIFMKNGKVIDAKIDKNFDVINTSPQEILIAAGLMKKPDAAQTGGK